MVEVINHGVYLLNGNEIVNECQTLTPDEARENTITYGILRSHDVDGSKGNKMRIRFDAMMYTISHTLVSSRQHAPAVSRSSRFLMP